MTTARIASAGTDTANTESSSAPTREKKCKLTQVDISTSTLPSSITEFISAKYAGVTIERAGSTDQNEFIIHVKKEDGAFMVLLFDANGEFVSEKAHKS